MTKFLIRYTFTLCLFFVSAVTFAAEDTATPPEGYQPTLSNTQYGNKRGKAAKDDPVVLKKADVLLIQTALPWGSNANTVVLNKLGYTYAIADIDAISTINLFDYKVVLIVNDQDQAFYNSYATKYTEFETYVKNGGTLLFFATDNGWAGGNNTTDLPGHVAIGDEFDNFNSIAKSNHVIVTGELTEPPSFTSYPKLTNKDLDGTYTSHNYFVESTLPDNATVVMRSKANKRPTLVSYPLGNGMVVASGITWEYTYDRFIAVNTQYGFGRALPDIINYAMTLGDGKKFDAALHVYPDDNRNPSKHPDLWKTPGDVLDVVAEIKNTTKESFENITVIFTIKENLVELPKDKLVFLRDDAWDIANNQLADDKYQLSSDAGNLIITVPNIAIKPGSQELVFRVMLNKATVNREVDAKVTLLNTDQDIINSQLLSALGDVKINDGTKHIITNRTALIEQYAQKTKDKVLFESFWESLYKIAADKKAVVHFADKFDRDYDDNNDNHIINWRDDRDVLKSVYDKDLESGNEEADINKAATAVADYLKNIIALSGGVDREGVYVAILGGDVIIPHYRTYDTTDLDGLSIVLQTSTSNIKDVFRNDGLNGYFHTDGFYRELDNIGNWKQGDVDNVLLGRLAGPDIETLHNLLKSSNRASSKSKNVVKVENAERDGELDTFQTQIQDNNFSLITAIDDVTVDEDVPFWFKKNFKDVAKTEDFVTLFSGRAENVEDFDLIRFMAHGDTEGLYSSKPNLYSYFSGDDILVDSGSISSSFIKNNPIFVMDACLVGQVDGNADSILLNSLLNTQVGGVVAASVVTLSYADGNISDYNDAFTSKLFAGSTTGVALSNAFKAFKTSGEFDDYHRLSVNLFGLPWAKVTRPKAVAPKKAKIRMEKDSKSVAARACGACNVVQEITVDASNFTVEHDDSTDFDFITVADFAPIRENESTPVLAAKVFQVSLPAGANVISVTFVQTAAPTALGALNIPGFTYGNPLPSASDDGARFVPLTGIVNNYPAQVVTYGIASLTDSTVLNINLVPFDFDPSNQQTTLYTQGKIVITYQSALLGTAQNLQTDLVEYTPGQDPVAQVSVSNTSTASSQFTAIYTLEDDLGNLLDTVTVNKVIASGVTDEVSGTLEFPDVSGGNYVIKVEVKDADDNVLTELSSDVSYAKIAIKAFTVPNVYTKEEVNTFSFTLDNLDDGNLSGSIRVDIYKSNNDELVSQLLEKNFDLPANALTKVDYVWIPPESLDRGKYYARVVLTINDVNAKPARANKAARAAAQSKIFTLKSPTFVVIGGGGNLVLNSADPDLPAGTIITETTTTTSKSGGAFGFMFLLLSLGLVRRKYLLKQ